MSSKYLCDKCGRSFDTRKGLLTHERTAPHYKLAQSFIEEEQNNMIANEQQTQQEEEEKEETSTVDRRNIRSKRRIENVETDNVLDLDRIEAKMINNDDTFSEVSSVNSEVYYRSEMVRSQESLMKYYHSSEDENTSIDDEFEESVRMPTSRYYDHQEVLLRVIYGKDTINSIDLEDFKNKLDKNNDSFKNSEMMTLYTFGKDCNLSRTESQRFIDIISNYSPYNNKCWRTIERTVKDDMHVTDYYPIKKTIPWPEHFLMSKWNHPNTTRLEDIVIRIRDPCKLIADQCISPFIQFLWKDHINMDCYEKVDDQGNKVYCDIMSSEWAREALDEIRKKDPEGMLLPLLLYWDGVALGQHMDTLVCPVMGTLGWYSKTLYQKDVSKFVIGFIEKMNNVSEAVLINHLVTVCKMASSKAKDNIAYFKKQLFLEFWKLCIDTMKEATNLGMKLKILGQEGTKIFFPRIAFLIGDDPAQHDVASIKCGSKVQHPCIKCMYDLSTGGAYDFDENNFRKLNHELLNNLRFAQTSYLKVLRDQPRGNDEKKCLITVQKKGYHPIYNPFFDADFGPNNSIYNSPPDLLHCFCAGMIKSVLLWTLYIIDAVSKYDGKDYNFSQNAGLFDMRLRQFPVIPRNIPHLRLCKFNKGLMKIAQSKTTKEKSYATGSGGKFRSSEYVDALFQSRFAVSIFILYHI
jgi:hypothetical protein